MRRQIFLLVFTLTMLALHTNATWSIIVIDTKTKKIGIAGASCTPSVYGIGAIIPGKGAIVVQAMSNAFARITGLKMMMAGQSPDAILKALQDPMFEPEEQQYAIVCIDYLDKPVTYTGTLTPTVKGALTQKSISVQGNTLANPKALQAVLNAAVKAQKDLLPIEEVLMLALEAGAKWGGDRRCGDTKASSAFLTVAKPNDDLKKPYLNVVVYGTEENVNAVEALRRKYDSWKSNSSW